MKERGSILGAIAVALPWCCILPATLALLGLAGAGTARVVAGGLMPYLLGLSALLLGRAHYLLHVRKQGAPWARWIVWLSTALVIGLWAPRLL